MHKQGYLIQLIKTVFPNPTWRQIMATIIIVWCLLILTFAGLGIFNVHIANNVLYLAGITLVGRGLKYVFGHEKTAPPGGPSQK
ncbi:hypothetical protein [Selenomonas ruminis]|uniref:Uncharacterized protein n=1 Tax=Selenomonas ruminis TaxID=2593411 RepID=A0A5D6VZK3_9FIRM|nr:hypothetical protein [Selenomonas sp. mPRGC5]TYZ19955.1 hypothetical protein FZ040_12695 [Selenomonas sp. mPRGC5]